MKIRTNYPLIQIPHPCFRASPMFWNVACCKCARMRFHCTNGLVVLRIYAHLEEHWLQKMRFVGSSAALHIV